MLASNILMKKPAEIQQVFLFVIEYYENHKSSIRKLLFSNNENFIPLFAGNKPRLKIMRNPKNLEVGNWSVLD